MLDRKDFIDWDWPPASDNANSAQQSVRASAKKKGQPVKVGLDSLGTRMDAGFPLMVPGA